MIPTQYPYWFRHSQCFIKCISALLWYTRYPEWSLHHLPCRQCVRDHCWPSQFLHDWMATSRGPAFWTKPIHIIGCTVHVFILSPSYNHPMISAFESFDPLSLVRPLFSPSPRSPQPPIHPDVWVPRVPTSKSHSRGRSFFWGGRAWSEASTRWLFLGDRGGDVCGDITTMNSSQKRWSWCHDQPVNSGIHQDILGHGRMRGIALPAMASIHCVLVENSFQQYALVYWVYSTIFEHILKLIADGNG